MKVLQSVYNQITNILKENNVLMNITPPRPYLIKKDDEERINAEANDLFKKGKIKEYISKIKEIEAYKLYFDEAHIYTNFYEERDEWGEQMLGNILKKLRKEKGITQEELGKILGVTTSMVGMYETNARKPSYEVLLKMADYFGVSTDYLLGKSSDQKEGEMETEIQLIQKAHKKVDAKIRKKMMDILKLTFEELFNE